MGAFLAEQWVTEEGALQLGWPRCGRAAGWPEALGAWRLGRLQQPLPAPLFLWAVGAGCCPERGGAQALPKAGKLAQLPYGTHAGPVDEKVKAFPR